mgnify:CR=1 FL=1
MNGLLRQTCTIRRNTPGTVDALGHPAESWGDLATGVRCAVQWRGGDEQAKPGDVTVYDAVAYFAAGQDVTDADQITAIDGGSEVLLVAAVMPAPYGHHVRALCRKVS